MSTSRPPPITDFASLKRIWDAQGKEVSNNSSDTALVTRRPLSCKCNPAAEEQSKAVKPESVDRAANSQRQLDQAQLLIANLTARQRFLEEQVSRLAQDLASKDAQINQLTGDFRKAREQIEGYAARDVEFTSLEEQEKALIEDRATLAADRASFERELDELDHLKCREADVAARESLLNQLQEELDHRQAEVGDLEATRAELGQRLLAVEAFRADHRKAESALASAKREIKKKSEETDALAAEVEQVKERLKKLQDRHRLLKTEYSEVQGQYATTSEALEKRAKELESSRSKINRLRVERDQAKARLASMPELSITSEALLHWLAQDGTPECIGLDEDSKLGWSGVGSYDPDAFDRLLIELGIQLYELPHPSITHVVVGRVGWSKEALLTQIDMRQGQTLRVYSQEMLLAALVTGRDPLDCEDSEVLDSFKKGHPALELLAESELEWPSFSASDTSQIDEIGCESLGVTESPLHLLGYKVGETSGMFREERQEVLREAFEKPNLPWVESDAYMEKWGAARSHQRLWRIAFHLAMLLNGPGGRDWRKPQARRDWLEDLEWLHDTFYTSRKFRFTWPDVAVVCAHLGVAPQTWILV